MKVFISENWEILTGLGGSVVAFFGGRKMKQNTLKSVELSNLSTVREMEKQLIDDLKSQSQELREIIESNRDIIDQKDQIIMDQKTIISKQNSFLGIYKKKYGPLEK